MTPARPPETHIGTQLKINGPGIPGTLLWTVENAKGDMIRGPFATCDQAIQAKIAADLAATLAWRPRSAPPAREPGA